VEKSQPATHLAYIRLSHEKKEPTDDRSIDVYSQ